MADAPLAKLLVPLAEAQEKITQQINRGREIVSSLNPAPGFGYGSALDRTVTLQAEKTKAEKWAKFTIDLLKSLITDLSIDREFGNSEIRYYGGDRTKELLQWMNDRGHRLDSILQRLPLFSSALKQVQATADEPSKHQNSPSESKKPGLRTKVFISWSGPLGHRVALRLREWLPAVLPCLDPWVSSEDIAKGTRWGTELANELNGTHSGIICLLPGHLTEPWLIFEAGALSKSVITARIHPLLFGVDPIELLPGPLAQFQATSFSKDDMRKLIHALNLATPEAALPTPQVDKTFDVCWLNLESQLTSLLADTRTDSARTKTDTRKPMRDLTEDELKILGLAANSRGLHPSEVAEVVSLHQQRIQHIMESLEEEGLLKTYVNDMGGHSWHLSKEGRAFVVKMDLL